MYWWFFSTSIIHTFSILGNLLEKSKKAVFLTVHDIGSNHNSFRDFIDHPCMSEIQARSIFIHLDLPGQETNAGDLPENYNFPTIQQMGKSSKLMHKTFHNQSFLTFYWNKQTSSTFVTFSTICDFLAIFCLKKHF